MEVGVEGTETAVVCTRGHHKKWRVIVNRHTHPEVTVRRSSNIFATMDSNSSPPNQLAKYVGHYLEVVKATLDPDKLAHYIDQNIVIAKVSVSVQFVLSF